jgi:hypothetical protein
VEVGGAELMAAPVMGGGAPAEDSAPTEFQRDEAGTVVKADTPTVSVTKGNEHHSAPWVVESPGGTVTTSAYNDGKKRCLSAEAGSGNPKMKVSKQNCSCPRREDWANSPRREDWVIVIERAAGFGDSALR